MSRKRPSPSPSRRPKAKVPAPGPSSNDPQLSHTSKTLLQVPQIDIRVTGEEVGSRAASPPFTSVPPSPDASDHLEASPSLLRRISRWTKSRIESLSPQAGSAAATDQKNTTLNAIKLLLQTSAAALKFAPIPQLDQIPNTLLAWINIYESATTNVEDMEKLHIVIRQVRDSVLQPLQEWTGEIPPELENLSRDFYA
ncbi:uncharacterized protein EI90DRAFT_2202550 [Cantharellus anzutake]|uniref:uncharacterized protein n=1 Tax=Cantharellus anzutake TaxID=1750568 RepID=UPI00190897D7|nr:uncharacterized protein EI90DRAFT_2202550 [Cantharellus anzutake]KAF8324967.1 hypothetical protein EI90DRAFT_2202550 [Cantharellus anzutake]